MKKKFYFVCDKNGNKFLCLNKPERFEKEWFNKDQQDLDSEDDEYFSVIESLDWALVSDIEQRMFGLPEITWEDEPKEVWLSITATKD